MSQPTRIPRRRKTNDSSQFLFSALILVGVIASLVGMYFYIEEQKSLNEKQLVTLVEKVEVIEDALSITNEDSVQNMETMTDQISFLDTEVRKLWGNALSREADEIEKELRRINSVLTEEETNE